MDVNELRQKLADEYVADVKEYGHTDEVESILDEISNLDWIMLNHFNKKYSFEMLSYE